MTKLLITGASGNLGSLIIRHLIETLAIPASDIVAGSRNPDKLTAFAQLGIETRKVDFDEPDLASAFRDIDRLLIISTDELMTAGKRLQQHTAAVEAAKAAKIGRIYYTSLPEAETSPISFAPDHLGTEDAIKASGMPYTILRNGWYQENIFQSIPNAIASGTLYTSSGNGSTAFIARDDIAHATAVALARPADGNATLTLTGERAYTDTELAKLVSRATGKPLEVVDIDDAQLAEGMAGAGLPAPLIPVLVSMSTAVREGKLSLITKDARTLIGAPLKSMENFVDENSAALAG